MYEGCATDYVTYTSAFVAVNYHPCFLFERDEFQKRETSQHLEHSSRSSSKWSDSEGGRDKTVIGVVSWCSVLWYWIYI